MGTSKNNATKYFTILMNVEEKHVKCNECDEKFYEYEPEYETSETEHYYGKCGSDAIEFEEDERCMEDWEVEELKTNIRESLREKFPHIGDSNYSSSSIGEINNSFTFAGLDIDISITIIVTSAYYKGVTLDYLINFDIGNYCDYGFNHVDSLEVNDLAQTLSVGMAKIQLPNVINKIKKEVDLMTAGIEEVFTKYSDQYARLGGLSDGTSVYVKA